MSSGIRMSLTGESLATIEKVSKLGKKLSKGQVNVQKKVVHKVVQMIRNDIYFEMVKLTPRRPATRSNDPRTLIDTKRYIRSFQARKFKGGWGVYAIRDLFEKHHNGTPNMVARPHVVLTLKRNRRKLSKYAAEELRKELSL